MASIGELISASAARGLGLVANACEPINPDQFARFPKGQDGNPVHTNHPAFVIGHLSLYPASALNLLGHDTGPATPPDGWAELYKAGVECHDGDTTTYHPKDELLSFFKASHDHVLSMIAGTDDEVFLRDHPNESTRAHFRTIGIMTNFYFTSHVMLHAGQLSAWRRMMGFGSIM